VTTQTLAARVQLDRGEAGGGRLEQLGVVRTGQGRGGQRSRSLADEIRSPLAL
jgi:hypothetical protein